MSGSIGETIGGMGAESIEVPIDITVPVRPPQSTQTMRPNVSDTQSRINDSSPHSPVLSNPARSALTNPTQQPSQVTRATETSERNQAPQQPSRIRDTDVHYDPRDLTSVAIPENDNIRIPGEENAPQTNTGRGISKEIADKFAVSKVQYERAIEIQGGARKQLLKDIFKLGKNTLKFIGPLALIYFGGSAIAGTNPKEAFESIKSFGAPILGKARDALLNIGQRIVGWGKGIETGFFDYNTKDFKGGGLFQKSMWYTGRLMEMAGFGINPDKFAIGATKAAGAPFAGIFGEGSIFYKGQFPTPALGPNGSPIAGAPPHIGRLDFGTFPAPGKFGKTFLPGMGILAGLYTAHKATRRVQNLLHQKGLLAVSDVKAQERYVLGQKAKAARLSNTTADATRYNQAKGAVDDRVRQIRREMEAKKVGSAKPRNYF